MEPFNENRQPVAEQPVGEAWNGGASAPGAPGLQEGDAPCVEPAGSAAATEGQPLSSQQPVSSQQANPQQQPGAFQSSVPPQQAGPFQPYVSSQSSGASQPGVSQQPPVQGGAGAYYGAPQQPQSAQPTQAPTGYPYAQPGQQPYGASYYSQQPNQNQVPPSYPCGYPQQPAYTQKPTLPNAVAVLVMGILSILASVYMVGVGIVLGIVALVLAAKGRKVWRQNPEAYSGIGMLNAGFVCAIIGTVIGSLLFLVGFFLGIVALLTAGFLSIL